MVREDPHRCIKLGVLPGASHRAPNSRWRPSIIEVNFRMFCGIVEGTDFCLALAQLSAFEVHPCYHISFQRFILFSCWVPFCCVCITACLSIHLLMGIQVVSSLRLLWLYADMNICVQIFVWIYIFFSLGYISRSGMTGSYSSVCVSHSVVSNSLQPHGL